MVLEAWDFSGAFRAQYCWYAYQLIRLGDIFNQKAVGYYSHFGNSTTKGEAYFAVNAGDF
jgi:hypothetical protein